MSTEIQLTPEQEAKKENWLKSLADFIVISNGKTWAADGAEVEPRRPGYKRLQWPYPENKMSEQDLSDYKGWEDREKQTYEFLKTALKQVSTEMPFRGPKEYIEGNKRYEFTLLQGDITDCLWREKITEDNQLTFTQTGLAGIVIQRDSSRQPTNPWDL